VFGAPGRYYIILEELFLFLPTTPGTLGISIIEEFLLFFSQTQGV